MAKRKPAKLPVKYSRDERLAVMDALSRYQRVMAIRATAQQLSQYIVWLSSSNSKSSIATLYATGESGGRISEEQVDQWEEKFGTKNGSYRLRLGFGELKQPAKKRPPRKKKPTKANPKLRIVEY